MARRNEVEIFGLSMLDTVTCGLGGAIVLMLFVASQIPPAAEISFVQEKAAQSANKGAVGQQNSAKTTSAILAVFFEVSQTTEPAHVRPRPCHGSSVQGLRIVELRQGEDLFGPDGLKRFGFGVWFGDNVNQIPPSAYCLNVPLGTECQRLSYVAGGHYTPPMACRPTPICFRFSASEQIYELKVCP